MRDAVMREARRGDILNAEWWYARRDGEIRGARRDEMLNAMR